MYEQALFFRPLVYKTKVSHVCAARCQLKNGPFVVDIATRPAPGCRRSAARPPFPLRERGVGSVSFPLNPHRTPWEPSRCREQLR